MKTVGRTQDDSESGVVLIIVALALVVLIGIVAIAIDGGYGFVQNRRAQNATDFAAFAAAQQLDSSASCIGTSPPPTMKQIDNIIQDLVQDNGSGIGSSWTAKFLDDNGNAIQTFTAADDSGVPPAGACGVSISATPAWKPFFAGLFGIHQLQGNASSTVGRVATGKPLGILALNKVGPHEILGGGTGTFVVDGDIFGNTDVTNQPWTESADGLEWDDAIDAKTSSNLYVYGTINTVNNLYNTESLWPLDHCFINDGLQYDPTDAPTPSVSNPDPSQTLPTYKLSCLVGGGTSVTVDYDNINNTLPQITDPLLSPDAPPNPLVNMAPCPGSGASAPQSFGDIPQDSTTLSPGVYTKPVELTGSVQFQDCPGGYPGVYQFQQGLWINPQSSNDRVTGSNVVIATGAPYRVAGNVPGSGVGAAFIPDLNPDGTEVGGNGAPCLPSGTVASTASGGQNETGSSQCGGSSPATNGVLAYHDTPVSSTPDSSMTGTGNNFSLIIGGVSGAQVTLTGPTTGGYGGLHGATGLVLYQDPGTQANYGFNAEAGDAADINVTGVVYNASLANYGADAPQDYWDGEGGGIPFYAGGTLQTGFGAGWSSGPTQSAGSFTLTGTAVVDDFNTDGATTITIFGQPYSLPGGSSLSLIG
jgi:Putative Flp pilus-assembly TadE/G-like